MDTLISKAIGVAGAVVAAASILGGCATTEPGARYVPPPLGATWSMLQRNTGSYGSGEVRVQGSRGDLVWEGRQMVTFKSSQGTTVADPATGAWVAFLAPDGKALARFEPPNGFDWPLVVGKQMKRSYKMTNAAGATTAVESACSVENYGDTTVAAGTFKAFRVSCRNSVGQNDLMWYAPELGIFVKTSLRRSAASPAGVGTRDSEITAQDIKR